MLPESGRSLQDAGSGSDWDIPRGASLGLSWWWLEPTASAAGAGCQPFASDFRLEPSSGVAGSFELASGDDAGSFTDERTRHLAYGQPAGIAAGCVCLGALLVAAGANLMRLSGDTERAKPAHRQRCYPLQLRWLCGALLLGLGHCGAFVALGFGAFWFVAELGLSVLVWNAALARWMNKEPLGCATALGVLLILAGLGSFALFASPHPDALWSADDMNGRWLELMYTTPHPFLYALAGGTLVLVAAALCCDVRLCASREAAAARRPPPAATPPPPPPPPRAPSRERRRRRPPPPPRRRCEH